jgi:hypothetical protein
MGMEMRELSGELQPGGGFFCTYFFGGYLAAFLLASLKYFGTEAANESAPTL